MTVEEFDHGYWYATELKAFARTLGVRTPLLRIRSGARYRLNRWREEQLAAPHGRYINFVADFYADRPTAARAEIIAAWHALKKMDCEKTYAAWSARR